MTLRVVAARLAEMRGDAVARAGAGSVSHRAGLLLTLEDERGLRGQGEASPLPGYSPDTLDACRAALEAAIVGLPREIDLSGPVAAAVHDVVEEIDAAVPAARMAFETALLDLAGKRLGAPVSVLLGRWDPGRAVPLSALLPPDDPAAALRAGLEHGLTTFKLKIGRPGAAADELALIERLRSVRGGRFALRLDVNEAWAPAEAPVRLAALALFEPEFVEQPVPRGLLADLPPSPVPVAADESMQDAAEARAILASRACRVVVLKPTVLGGPVRCLDLARSASRAGLEVVVSHAFEGPVALAMACELALAVDPRPRACGLAPHGGLAAWPPVAVPQLGRAAVLARSHAGLGLAEIGE